MPRKVNDSIQMLNQLDSETKEMNRDMIEKDGFKPKAQDYQTEKQYKHLRVAIN